MTQEVTQCVCVCCTETLNHVFYSSYTVAIYQVFDFLLLIKEQIILFIQIYS